MSSSLRSNKGILYNLSILSVGQLVSQLANMAALVYLAGFLGAHWFGVIQVGVAFMSYALITAEWGMMSLGIREVSRLDDPQRIRSYAQEQMALLAVQAALVLGLGLLVLPRLPFYQHAPVVFLLYLATVIPQVYTQNWVAVGLEKMGWVGASRIVRSLVYATLVLVGLRHLGDLNGQPAAIWVPAIFLVAMIASNLVVNIPLARWFGGFLHPRMPSWQEATQRWRETSSIGTNIIILRVLFNIDILLLGVLAAPEAAGNYAAASRVIFLLVVAVEVLWAALLPRLSRLAKQSRPAFQASFNLYLGLVSAILLPTAVGGYLVGKDFMHLLYGEKFPAAGPVFQVLAVAYTMLALGTFLGNTLLAENRQKWYLLPLVVSSLTATFGVMVLVPNQGVQGAAWAMFCAHGLLLAILLVVNFRNFLPQLGLLLVGIVPALTAMTLTIGALGTRPVVWRVPAAIVVYLLLAAWPVLRFQRQLRPRTAVQ
jgi:O-antigen/teichoic acid export membrane protein